MCDPNYILHKVRVQHRKLKIMPGHLLQLIHVTKRMSTVNSSRRRKYKLFNFRFYSKDVEILCFCDKLVNIQLEYFWRCFHIPFTVSFENSNYWTHYFSKFKYLQKKKTDISLRNLHKLMGIKEPGKHYNWTPLAVFSTRQSPLKKWKIWKTL